MDKEKWYICTMEYYLAVKKYGILKFAGLYLEIRCVVNDKQTMIHRPTETGIEQETGGNGVISLGKGNVIDKYGWKQRRN